MKINGIVTLAYFFLSCTLGTSSIEAAQTAPTILKYIDADENGLYDDIERKLLLDELQIISPELKANYDVDGDGKVSVEEQTAGRHPLTQIADATIIEASSNKIPPDFPVSTVAPFAY